jgi:hypothetical protein
MMIKLTYCGILRCIYLATITFIISAFLYLLDTKSRRIAPPVAYAQENAALSQIAQLTMRKGFKDIGLGDVCNRLHIAVGNCRAYQLNAAVDAAESKKFGLQAGWLSSLNVLNPQGGTAEWIVIVEHDEHIGYAFLIGADEDLQAATVGLSTTAGGKAWRWKPMAITDEIRQKFLLERTYWLAQRKDIENLPDRKD